MTGVVVLVVVAIVGLAIAWTRMTSARSERKSVNAHERRLDVLGHVARRSDAAAVVRAPLQNELARPHVAPTDSRQLSFEGAMIPPEPPRARVHSATIPPQKLPVFGADSESTRVLRDERAKGIIPEVPQYEHEIIEQNADETGYVPIVAQFADESVPEHADARVSFERPMSDAKGTNAKQKRSRQRRGTRATSGLKVPTANHVNRRTMTGAAAVAVGAIAVGGWQLAMHGNQPSVVSPSTHTHVSGNHRALHSTTNTGPIRPTVTANTVSVAAPSGPYTVTFGVSGECWLGIEMNNSSNGPWLAMKTLESNGSWTYQANGPIVIRIGAPRTLSMKINNQVVVLPKTAQPYDITLTGSATAA